ncbi:MAG: zinc ribbon domain-containing protein [Clostridia bacterium]|nr:zinc ribbon domain-containing protein [Clostridia bacterium]
MKYCSHCGKPVTENMRFCMDCGTDLHAESNVSAFTQSPSVAKESPKEEAVVCVGVEQAIAKWKEDPKNKFISERTKLIKIITTVAGWVLAVILGIWFIMEIMDIRDMKLPEEMEDAMCTKKLKTFLIILTLVDLPDILIFKDLDIYGYVRFSMAEFIKKGNLNRRVLIEDIAKDKPTAVEYVESPMNTMDLKTLFSDAIFTSSIETERTKFLMENLIPAILKVMGTLFVLITFFALPTSSINDLIVDGFFKQPLFYFGIACNVGAIMLTSKLDKMRKERKLNWLKKEASDLFSDLKLAK